MSKFVSPEANARLQEKLHKNTEELKFGLCNAGLLNDSTEFRCMETDSDRNPVIVTSIPLAPGHAKLQYADRPSPLVSPAYWTQPAYTYAIEVIPDGYKLQAAALQPLQTGGVKLKLKDLPQPKFGKGTMARLWRVLNRKQPAVLSLETVVTEMKHLATTVKQASKPADLGQRPGPVGEEAPSL